MPLFTPSKKAITKATLQSAANTLGSGAKLEGLEDLRNLKNIVRDNSTLKMTDVTTAKIRETFRTVGELQGYNTMLAVAVKGRQMARQEALKTVSLGLQDKTNVIRTESQLQQTMSRYAVGNAGATLQMDANLAQWDGIEVHLDNEVKTLLKGWNG